MIEIQLEKYTINPIIGGSFEIRSTLEHIAKKTKSLRVYEYVILHDGDTYQIKTCRFGDKKEVLPFIMYADKIEKL